MELVRDVYKRSYPSEPLPNGGREDDHDVFYRSFDPDEESLVEVIVESVATIHNVEPTDLEPLYDVVNVDALEELYAGRSVENEGVDEVRFVYEGLEVTIDRYGHVWLQWAGEEE